MCALISIGFSFPLFFVAWFGFVLPSVPSEKKMLPVIGESEVDYTIFSNDILLPIAEVFILFYAVPRNLLDVENLSSRT